jgi:thioredoxin reductase (NADPH)
MSDKIYDIVIIGSGPAGLTAAIYSAQAGLDVALITGE